MAKFITALPPCGRACGLRNQVGESITGERKTQSTASQMPNSRSKPLSGGHDSMRRILLVLLSLVANVASGAQHDRRDVRLAQLDVRMTARGGTLELERHYDSKAAYDGRWGAFGRGWRSTYEQALEAGSYPQVQCLTKPNGETVWFDDFDGDGTFRATRPATEDSWLEPGSVGYVRRFVNGASEQYDGAGRLVAIRQNSASAITITRDAAGRMLSVHEPGGRAMTFQYAGDRITALSGPLGVIAGYEYDNRGFLKGVSYPDQSGFAFTYTDLGQVLTVTDHSGRVTQRHEYQNEKAILSESANGQNRVSVAFGDSYVHLTDARGYVTTYEYEPIFGDTHLTRIVYPSGETEDWEYDERGRLLRHKSPGGSTTTNEYDAQGHLVTHTDGAKAKTQFGYRDDGQIDVVTLPTTKVGRFTYGPFGPTQIDFSQSGFSWSERIEYDDRGLIVRTTDSKGRVTARTYSPSGDVLTLTDPEGGVEQFEYDAMGRQISRTDASGRITATMYDSVGRVSKVTYASGASVSYTYDRGGRRLTEADHHGRTTSYAYDEAGRLETVTDAAGGVTRFGYDAMSNRTSIADAEGRTTTYEYDGNNRVVRTTFPDALFERLAYDQGGRLHTRTDRRGVVTTHTYDAAERLIKKVYSDGTAGVSFAYDQVGNMVAAVSAVDTLTWSFGVVADQPPNSEVSRRNSSTLSHIFAEDGSRLGLSLDGDALLGYRYDGAGQLAQVNHRLGAFELQRDRLSRVTAIRYPNGATTHYDFDSVGQLAQVRTVVNGQTLSSLSYAYDAAGNRKAKTDGDRSEFYGYDALSRLTQVERPSTSQRWNWNYDRVGNRTEEHGPNGSSRYEYSPTNELLRRILGDTVRVAGTIDEPGAVTVNDVPLSSDSSRFEGAVALGADKRLDVVARDAAGNQTARSYEVSAASGVESMEYDANGNPVRRSIGSDTWTYDWDAEDRLRRVLRNGAEIARFLYDPLGRRVEKIAGSVRHSYLYDGQDVLRETITAGSQVRRILYVHGPGVDQPLAAADAGAETARYFHADALGSISRVTDAAGLVVGSFEYDAWGKPEGAAAPSGYAFTGREWDSEAELYYYRARYYSPVAGRFINEDPIRFRGGTNFYTYANNNPVNVVDPYGLQGVPPPWMLPRPPAEPEPPCSYTKCVAKCYDVMTGWMPGLADKAITVVGTAAGTGMYMLDINAKTGFANAPAVAAALQALGLLGAVTKTCTAIAWGATVWAGWQLGAMAGCPSTCFGDPCYYDQGRDTFRDNLKP
jgi:RHS repeat-associated protein